MTVNEALTLMKHVKDRIRQLEATQSRVSSRTLFHDEDRSEELQYDPYDVEERICFLRQWLMNTDMEIKKSNSVTTVNVELTGQLLGALPRRDCARQ